MKSDELDFCVIVGLDGSGKTTLISDLEKNYSTFAGIDWKMFSSVLTSLQSENCRGPAQVIDTLSSQARAAAVVYLVSLELHSVQQQLATGKIPVVDSYWYRFAAKNRILMFANKWIEDVFDQLPEPRLVIFLDIDPEECLRRKQPSHRYEYGTTQDTAIEFQKEVRQTLISLLPKKQTITLRSSPDAASLNEIILEALGASAAC